MQTLSKTWNEFWGEFLLVTFHKDDPQKWTALEKKVDWLEQFIDIAGNKILDLACGSGLLDIILARRSAEVTAVDRIKTVLEIASSEAGSLPVEFIYGDMRSISFPENTFDNILILETLGLMSRSDDNSLVRNVHRFLKPGGILICDCPRPGFAEPNNWSREFPDGVLTFDVSFDKDSSIQTIITEFKTNENKLITLFDPYDLDTSPHTGVKRYLYPENEFQELLSSNGFSIEEIPHYWNEKYIALKSIKA